MGFNKRKRSRAARMREALQEQQSAGTSRSRSRASTTRKRRSTSSSQNRVRTTAPRKRQSTSSSQSRSRATTTRKRQSTSSSQSRPPAAPTQRRKTRSSSRTQARTPNSRVSSQNQGSVTSSSSKPPAAPAAVQQQTASQPQTRSVNGTEEVALEFTFGLEVGEFLADTIEIEEKHGDIVSTTRMFLPPNYNSGNLSDLGDFIGKAVRIWQQNTGRYTSNKGDAGYDYRELYRDHLTLNSKQHVAVVTHWFYVNYGVEYNRIGSRADQIPKKDLWSIILDVIELDDDHKTKFRSKSYGGEKAAMRQIVNNHYACVILEIRNPRLLKRGTQTHWFPVPNLNLQTV